MKYHKQLFLHDPENGSYGDCHRTAIACILGLEPEEVPNFAEQFFDDTMGFNKAFNEWAANRNLAIVDIPYDCSLDRVLEAQEVHSPNSYYLLGGLSKNGTNHTVVCKGGEILHDPAIDNSGIVGPMQPDGYFWVSYLVPINYDKTNL